MSIQVNDHLLISRSNKNYKITYSKLREDILHNVPLPPTPDIPPENWFPWSIPCYDCIAASAWGSSDSNITVKISGAIQLKFEGEVHWRENAIIQTPTGFGSFFEIQWNTSKIDAEARSGQNLVTGKLECIEGSGATQKVLFEREYVFRPIAYPITISVEDIVDVIPESMVQSEWTTPLTGTNLPLWIYTKNTGNSSNSSVMIEGTDTWIPLPIDEATTSYRLQTGQRIKIKHEVGDSSNTIYSSPVCIGIPGTSKFREISFDTETRGEVRPIIEKLTLSKSSSQSNDRFTNQKYFLEIELDEDAGEPTVTNGIPDIRTKLKFKTLSTTQLVTDNIVSITNGGYSRPPRKWHCIPWIKCRRRLWGWIWKNYYHSYHNYLEPEFNINETEEFESDIENTEWSVVPWCNPDDKIDEYRFPNYRSIWGRYYTLFFRLDEPGALKLDCLYNHYFFDKYWKKFKAWAWNGSKWVAVPIFKESSKRELHIGCSTRYYAISLGRYWCHWKHFKVNCTSSNDFDDNFFYPFYKKRFFDWYYFPTQSKVKQLTFASNKNLDKFKAGDKVWQVELGNKIHAKVLDVDSSKNRMYVLMNECYKNNFTTGLPLAPYGYISNSDVSVVQQSSGNSRNPLYPSSTNTSFVDIGPGNPIEGSVYEFPYYRIPLKFPSSWRLNNSSSYPLVDPDTTAPDGSTFEVEVEVENLKGRDSKVTDITPVKTWSSEAMQLLAKFEGVNLEHATIADMTIGQLRDKLGL